MIPFSNLELDFNEANLASGISIYLLNAEVFIDTKKMILVK